MEAIKLGKLIPGEIGDYYAETFVDETNTWIKISFSTADYAKYCAAMIIAEEEKVLG